MKNIKQEYIPVPRNTIRIIICEGDSIGVKRTIIQTTTMGEYKMLKALVMYQGTPEGKRNGRLSRSQSSQAHTAP